jgi:GNAT superfamily N-acetyltransferase
MSRGSYYITTAVRDDVFDFDSGYDNFNRYLIAKNDRAVMHYILELEDDRIVAYFSLLSSALLFGEPPNLSIHPAIELKMFALDKKLQGKGVAVELLKGIEQTIVDYATECVGAEMILLFSVPVEAVMNLYESRGFRYLDDFYATYRSAFNASCRPMYK